MFKRWQLNRKRRALGRLSINDLLTFRNNCVALCLPNGTVFHVKHPTDKYAPPIKFYPNVRPAFAINGELYVLTFTKDLLPYLHLTNYKGATSLNICEALDVALLLKHFSKYFPYVAEPLEIEEVA